MGSDEIETERLILRRWRPTDLDALTAVFAKPEVWWYPAQRGYTAQETRAFLERKLDLWSTQGYSQWAAVLKPDMLIGFLGLQPPEFLPEVMPTVEIGWRLDPDSWGRGLATEGGHPKLGVDLRVYKLTADEWRRQNLG